MSFRRRIAHTHSTGLTRREILQVGYSGAMGLALPALFANRAQAAAAASAAAPPRDGKKMLLVWTTGAMSHHDTVDMKPDAPAAVRLDVRVDPPPLELAVQHQHLHHCALREARVP